MLETHGNDEFMGGDASGGAGSAPLAVGARVRVGRLADLKSVRSEAGKLYREARARAGRYPDALTAMRLANILSTVRALVEIEQVAERVDALERAAGVRP
jgi:hypothetical protein